MTRLPVCLVPDPTEALPGYLLRVSEANGYPMSYLLGKALDRTYPSRTGQPSVGAIAPLTGLSPAQEARLNLSSEIDASRARMQLLGNELTTVDCRMSAPRVCPQCLAETGVCSALWDLAQVTACPIHGTLLLEQCQVCEQPLRWSRTRVCFCRCGADLRRQAVKEMPAPTVVGLASVFRYKLLGGSPPAAEWDHLKHLVLYGLSRLSWVLAGVAQDPWNRRGTVVRSRAKLGNLDAAAAMLADWPTGFRIFLDKTYRGELEHAATIPQFRNVFRWARDRLDINYGERRPMIHFVMAEVYRFAAQFWSRNKLGDVAGFESVLPEHFRWGSIIEAAELTGLQISTLGKRISAGQVPVCRVAGSKPIRAVMVDLDWARNRKRSVRSLGIRAAARHIGLPIHTLRALRQRKDVYHERHYCEHSMSFAVEDLDDLSKRVSSLAGHKLRTVPPEAITISALFDTNREWGTTQKVALIAALLAGDIQAVGRRYNSILGTVINQDVAEAFLARQIPVIATVTLQAAAADLGTTMETARGLALAGYLERTVKLGRQQIRADSLSRFKKNHVLLGSLTGASCRHLAKRVRERGFDLVEVQMLRSKSWLIPRRQLKQVQRFVKSL